MSALYHDWSCHLPGPVIPSHGAWVPWHRGPWGLEKASVRTCDRVAVQHLFLCLFVLICLWGVSSPCFALSASVGQAQKRLCPFLEWWAGDTCHCFPSILKFWVTKRQKKGSLRTCSVVPPNSHHHCSPGLCLKSEWTFHASHLGTCAFSHGGREGSWTRYSTTSVYFQHEE